MAFSPVNELLLCSAGLDKLLLFYDVQANKLVKTMTCEAPLHSLDFMNDGFTVAAGTSTGKVLVYDLRTLGQGGTPTNSFSVHAFSPGMLRAYFCTLMLSSSCPIASNLRRAWMREWEKLKDARE